MIRIGDFVTASNAGYWQLIDIKPKIAAEDYSYGEIRDVLKEIADENEVYEVYDE